MMSIQKVSSQKSFLEIYRNYESFQIGFTEETETSGRQEKEIEASSRRISSPSDGTISSNQEF
ncbi:hypothetical protein EHO59_07005 [Leptospira semungkisensis]|uniref:Uncharacterized protein n=1 Tax=Leptospira semungkisensis TaxID=2484985 RepID=A0A4R9G9U6_9LEPT|nr:hypothetical protein [Leptospira semungkisensis]TGK07840.1 hypothetical protein EHO59_07005 [Leptospira semungkisensis]